MWRVLIEQSAQRALRTAPHHIQERFEKWKDIAQLQGPHGILSIKGLYDHALKGQWQGARSSRLNYQWRIIYFLNSKELAFYVLEVTPHDYRKKS